jgi:hypothetical protein
MLRTQWRDQQSVTNVNVGIAGTVTRPVRAKCCGCNILSGRLDLSYEYLQIDVNEFCTGSSYVIPNP